MDWRSNAPPAMEWRASRPDGVRDVTPPPASVSFEQIAFVAPQPEERREAHAGRAPLHSALPIPQEDINVEEGGSASATKPQSNGPT